MKAVVESLTGRLILAGVCLAVLGLGLSRLPAADPDPEPQPPAIVAIETFKGRLHLRWKPVRPDPKYVSLTKNKGKLTITTQRGSIHGDEAARKDLQARNIYLIDNPLPDDGDFEVTTCVSGFTPRQQYQQAALILYNDDDNYLKWSYEFSYVNGGSVALGLVRETAAKTQHDHVAAPEKADQRLWLRLTRRKNSYEYASSTDGKTYTVHGEREWGDKAPGRIGILAKNGGPAGVPEVDVCFERFELRSPPSPKSREGRPCHCWIIFTPIERGAVVGVVPRRLGGVAHGRFEPPIAAGLLRRGADPRRRGHRDRCLDMGAARRTWRGQGGGRGAGRVESSRSNTNHPGCVRRRFRGARLLDADGAKARGRDRAGQPAKQGPPRRPAGVRDQVRQLPASGSQPLSRRCQDGEAGELVCRDDGAAAVSRAAPVPAEEPLYAVAHRPLRRNGDAWIDLWGTKLAIGEALPPLPLGITAELCLPVDLEEAYMDARRRRRL